MVRLLCARLTAPVKSPKIGDGLGARFVVANRGWLRYNSVPACITPVPTSDHSSSPLNETILGNYADSN